jgi:hypothetical protein
MPHRVRDTGVVSPRSLPPRRHAPWTIIRQRADARLGARHRFSGNVVRPNLVDPFLHLRRDLRLPRGGRRGSGRSNSRFRRDDRDWSSRWRSGGRLRFSKLRLRGRLRRRVVTAQRFSDDLHVSFGFVARRRWRFVDLFGLLVVRRHVIQDALHIRPPALRRRIAPFLLNIGIKLFDQILLCAGLKLASRRTNQRVADAAFGAAATRQRTNDLPPKRWTGLSCF